MNFRDLRAGQAFRAGPRTVSAAEIIEFAQRYDPQPFHVDAAAAAASRWGGLIASGWMTCCVAMRLAVEAVHLNSDSMGSPGVEALEWLHPVRPGDALGLTMTVLEAKPSRTGRVGAVRWAWSVTNQEGVEVMRMKATSLYDLAASRPTIDSADQKQ